MKKTLTSNKAHAAFAYHKHLGKDGKRMANRATRRLFKVQDNA
jgi:hypothetical protein